MMRIVEKSPDRLILSNAYSFWVKWGFVSAIITLFLVGIFVAIKVIRPTCWSGAAIGFFILFMIIRELPRSFDTEFRFDREGEKLIVIKRPWLGKAKVEQYPLLDITAVRLVETKHRRNYPGYDYIEDENRPIEPPVYEVELGMRSENKLMVYGATHLAGLIAVFLELTLAAPS